MRRALVFLAMAGLVALSGCGGAMGPSGTEFIDAADIVPVTLAPAFDQQNPRWLDVANTPYSASFVSTYSYSQAVVTATLVTSADGLVITLDGTGLKPNFAYQVKLEGQPSVDLTANAILGGLGRWWEGTGYLIAGYFVTDAAGTITSAASSEVWPDAAIRVDSSYHVLWTTDQRRPTRSDGPIIGHKVIQTLYGYDVSQNGDMVKVYGEWQSGRPKPGNVVLPDGDYTCLLRLTEEGFHLSGDLWKTVLEAQVSFTIGGSEPPPPPSSAGSIAGTVTYAGGAAAKRVEVGLLDGATRVASTSTRGNGAYSFADVPAGITYTVTASDGSLSASTPAEVLAGQTTIADLVLE